MSSTLINCEACKKELSKEAAACPHCGHPNKSAPRKVGCCGSIFVVILVMFVIGSIVSKNNNSSSNVSPNSTTSAAPPKPKTEAEIKQEKLNQKLEAKFGPRPSQSAWDGSYREVKKHLKKAANDPDSIKIESCTGVSYNEKVGWLVGCDYRGKNAFGGLVKNSNWFVIKGGMVVKVLPANSYK